MRAQILGIGLDRFHHQVQFAEPTFPLHNLAGECRIGDQQGTRLLTLLGIERAEDVLGGERIRMVDVAHEPRHCSTSARLRRSDARSRWTGMSSFIESCSRLNAPK